MKFNTIAEAFNFYRNHTNAQIEARTAEINGIIDTDANADINALNIELAGLKQAKENNEQRSAQQGAGFNVVTGMNNGGAAKRSFDMETIADQPEYRSAFLKSLIGQPLNDVEKEAYRVGVQLAEKRADAFNSTSDSLAVLPTQTLNEIVKKARTMGGLMAECRAFNIPANIAVPIATPSSAATWHAEGAEQESEKVNLASVTFNGFELIKIFSISAKVRKMSIAAFEAYLVEELRACCFDAIAAALVNGTGNGQGTGLEKGVTWKDNTNAVKVAAGGSVAYADVVKAVAMLKRGYSAGAKWAMNNSTLYNVFYGMVDANKRPIFIADPKGDAIGSILGFPVVIDDNIADNVAYLGAYSRYLGYNLPEGIAIEASTQSSFKKGLIDYRALAVCDCKPIVSEAFVKLYVATA